jgi:hypothetical protein
VRRSGDRSSGKPPQLDADTTVTACNGFSDGFWPDQAKWSLPQTNLQTLNNPDPG